MQREIRAIMIIPGRAEDDHLMPFVRRQFRDLNQQPNLCIEPFYFDARSNPRALVSSYRRFRELSKRFKPDIVHAQFGTMTAAFAAVASRTKLILTCRGSDLNPAPGDSFSRSLLGRTLTQAATLRSCHVICVSEQLRSRLWFRPRNASVVPNGVDLERFQLHPRSSSRKLLNWDQGDLVALFNARNDPVGKRLDLAERGVEYARTSFPGLRLEVLRGMVPPDQIPHYMAASDCLLMTSDFEGSPNIVKEALACNLPVIAVEVGDVPERLKDVVPSAICKRDPESIGEGISRVLSVSKRSNGREIISKTLSSDAIAKQILAIYQAATR